MLTTRQLKRLPTKRVSLGNVERAKDLAPASQQAAPCTLKRPLYSNAAADRRRTRRGCDANLHTARLDGQPVLVQNGARGRRERWKPAVEGWGGGSRSCRAARACRGRKRALPRAEMPAATRPPHLRAVLMGCRCGQVRAQLRLPSVHCALCSTDSWFCTATVHRASCTT